MCGGWGSPGPIAGYRPGQKSVKKSYRAITCACFSVALKSLVTATLRSLLGFNALGVLATSTVVYVARRRRRCKHVNTNNFITSKYLKGWMTWWRY